MIPNLTDDLKKVKEMFNKFSKIEKALENLFVEVSCSFQPFHWDKRIMKALDDAAEVIGKDRRDELFKLHPNNPDNKDKK